MRKYNLLIIFILFLFIYEPPLFKVNVLHIIGVFSWIYIFINNKSILNVMNLKTIIRTYVILFIFLIYLAIVTLYNGNSILNTFSFVYWIIDIFPISLMLCLHFSRKKYSFYDFLNILLITGSLQALTALISLISPSVKEFFLYKLINYGYSDRFIDLSNLRMYGFASNLTYSTPILQAVMASISVYLAINKGGKYIFFTPLLLFSAIINARTSFIIFAIGIFAIIIASKKINIKSIIRLSIIGVALFITINVGLSFLKNNANETYDWVLTGFNEIVNLFEDGPNQTEGYFAYINSSERYILPDDFGILFGVGERILSTNNYGVRSDIGYINDIWLGGLLYTVFIYIYFIFILNAIGRADGSNNRDTKFLYILLLGTFFVSNIKGYIFVMNNMTNLLFLIFTFIAVRKNKYKINI
ncbi:hypothetical protein ABES23_11490 [Peribacillus frigoritolerans]|uniref:hypothetical protein n=1 Tax=Peribacillus frigoritolerans TaxID=450367 RepID=UPI003D2CB2D8